MLGCFLGENGNVFVHLVSCQHCSTIIHDSPSCSASGRKWAFAHVCLERDASPFMIIPSVIPDVRVNEPV